MGWVSYLEDITDRLTDDLGRLRVSLSRADIDAGDVRRQAEALLEACETALADIRNHLELATDPHFDMAYEITQLDKEKAQLESEITDLGARRNRLVIEIDRLQSEGRDLRLENKHLQRQIEIANQDFEELAAANPAAAFDLYSTDEHRRTHKPDD